MELLFPSTFKHPTFSVDPERSGPWTRSNTFKRSTLVRWAQQILLRSHCDLLDGSNRHDASPCTAAEHDVGEMLRLFAKLEYCTLKSWEVVGKGVAKSRMEFFITDLKRPVH